MMLEPQTYLKRAFNEKRLSHAYLFRGQEGCGQLLTARWLLQLINCRGEAPPCGKCTSCQKIEANVFQDARFIHPTGEAVKVHKAEAIRELVQWINLLPSEGNYRAAVILQAEAMNQQAANSLLKTLEEAPSRGIFILVSSRSGRLLPTLLSRCIPVDFKPLPEKELASLLVDQSGVTQEVASQLAERAQGRIEKGFAMAQIPDTEKEKEDYLAKIGACFASGDRVGLLYLASQLSGAMKSEEQETPFLDEFQRWFYDSKSENLPLPELEKGLYRIEKAKEEIAGRANPRLVLENLFLSLQR